jgi:exonuclease III
MLNADHIDALNRKAELDFFTEYNREYHDVEVDDDPYFGINVNSKYYDIENLAATEFVKATPLYISINIQSLQSKFNDLCSLISEFAEKNIDIDVIALQEVWDIRYPELFSIPGYKPLICKTRRGMRGGGVGFYVKDYLNAHILDELSLFENKILESLTIKITYPDNKSVIVTSVYRSNGSLPNVTPSQQMNSFLDMFSELLTLIQNVKIDAYVCMDSNIDLLKLSQQTPTNFLNLILEKGFLPSIAKATRCQNDSKTLIDQILFNKNCTNLNTGTIVSDTSDHFITFIAPPKSS